MVWVPADRPEMIILSAAYPRASPTNHLVAGIYVSAGCPSLRTRLPTLWTRSYFAGSVGQVSEATLCRYIEAQKGR